MRQGMKAWWNEKGAVLRLPILCALWTLILVTLLSALAPLGPPRSRATGSAFNPATADVVLKGRALVPLQMVATPRPDGDGTSPLTLVVALAAIPLVVHLVLSAIPAARYRRAIRSFAPVRTRRARAPPATS